MQAQARNETPVLCSDIVLITYCKTLIYKSTSQQIN
jgi:hypothetical protein